MTKQKITDPFAEREAEKYENPIPSREYVLEYLGKKGRPAKREEIFDDLHIVAADARDAMRRRLRAMERDGQLVLTRRGGYGLVDKMNLIRGRVIGHKDGFGFVVPEDGSADLFLNPRYMRAVFDGDRVLVRIAGVDQKGRREAAVVEVLEHAVNTLVGRFFSEDGVTYVAPDNKRINQDILIPHENAGGAEHGQIVLVEIVEHPSLYKRPIGRVTEVLGEHMAPGMEIDVAIYNHNIPNVWPEAVLEEVAPLKNVVTAQDMEGHVDVRDLPFVTIDGEDAKDFDDAVYCKRRTIKGGWTLYVAIADVSHYVRPNTALDSEALKRGNSVYFPGSVIPMLPEILSNGLCSLNPVVDRLCLVCEMTISGSGNLTGYKFYPGVMHSQARLTYTEVTSMLENKQPGDDKRTQKLLPLLRALHALYEKLRSNREARGAIDFETTETRVIFGPDRKIQQIVPTVRTVAHRIIEECMLMANVSAARFLEKNKLPGLYRIHAGPTAEKLQDLREFLAGLGLRLPGGKEPKPGDYAELLRSIEGRPDSQLIQTVLLRSLSQAVYSPDNIGHFGLAFGSYAHFTSPIRRYPDLLVHRAIKYGLTGGKADKFGYDHAAMLSFGEHSSMTERRADDATRDALDWLKCEYMRDRVGEDFAGIITSVTSFGLFVALKDVYVEGLVHISALKNDYYQYDTKKHRLLGERSGKIYRLGDQIKVKVVRVNLEDRRIDFNLVDGEQQSAAKGKKPKSRQKKRPR